MSSDAEHRELDELRAWLTRVKDVGDEILNSIEHHPDDHFAFMGGVFLSKQLGHAEALLLLRDHQDMQLVARSMMEGLGLLYWAYRDQPARPLRWRHFAWVRDWRRMRQMDRENEPVEPERRRSIEEALRQFGPQFYTAEARRQRSSGGPLPDDPYRKDWLGHQIRQVFEEANSLPLYEKPYSASSGWQHWGPEGLGPALSQVDGVHRFATRSIKTAVAATRLGVSILLDTYRLLDIHLKLSQSQEIATMCDELRAGAQRGHDDPL